MADDADRLNRPYWDEVAGLHGQDGYYDTEAFLGGEPSLTRRELDEIRSAVGSVGGIDVLHLQCHLGLDSLSLARMGARVVGIDYSQVAIGRARALAATAGIRARFVQADARALPPELRRRIRPRLRVLRGAHLGRRPRCMDGVGLRCPQTGRLDGHCRRSSDPTDGGVDRPTGIPRSIPRPATVGAGGCPLVRRADTLKADRIVEYPYGLGEVVTAAVRAGFRVDALTEYLDEEDASRGGILVEADGRFVLLMAGGHLPTLFALRAQKPNSEVG